MYRRQSKVSSEIEDFLSERSPEFFERKRELINAVHLKIYGRPRRPGEDKANVCGYVACAVRHGVAQLMPDLPVRTVYGQYDNRLPHYWNEVGWQRGMYIDGAHGYFNPEYENQFLILPRAQIESLNLEEYEGGGTSLEDAMRETLLLQRQHPFKDYMRGQPEIIAAYRRLVASLLA